jgi:hypothetical protein
MSCSIYSEIPHGAAARLPDLMLWVASPLGADGAARERERTRLSMPKR